MHLDTIFGLITERKTAARRDADQLPAQIITLTNDLARIDAELTDLATTHNTPRTLAAAEFTARDPTAISSAYQQILAALETSDTGMRTKDSCLALDIEPLPKHVESTRAKLKRIVSRSVLIETSPAYSFSPRRDVISASALSGAAPIAALSIGWLTTHR